MIRRALSFALVIVALMAATSPAWAANSETKEKLKQIESQLDQQKEQAAALAAKSKEANDNLQGLRQKLIAATASLNAKEDEQDRLEDKLDELVEDTKTKSGDLNNERHKLDLLTQALIELSQQPPQSLLLHAGLTGDTIHRTIVLRAVLPRVKEQAETLAHDLSTLDNLKARMDEQKRLVAAAAQNLEDQRHALDQLVATRQGLLQRTEQQKQAVEAQLVSLASQAKDLRQLMEKVTPRRAPHAPAEPEHAAPLKTPVSGRIMHHFGDRDADGVVSDGVTFTTLPGAPVVAPMAGRVVFAGPFKGYGRIVILQHDGGYHSFLAGFGRVDAEMDQDVEAGEPLGVMPVQGGVRPQLYFEWRHNSEPIQPAGLQ